MMRRMTGGRLGDLIPVTDTNRFEARPSIVCDASNRAWFAPVVVPDSDGLLDGRPALVTCATNGALYTVYSSDGRNHDFGQPVQYKLFVDPIAWVRGQAPAPALASEAAHPAAGNAAP